MAGRLSLNNPSLGPSEMARVGMYRRAAIASLRDYRAAKKLSIILPISLLKIKKFSLSLHFSLVFAVSDREVSPKIISCVAESVKGVTLKRSDIDNAFLLLPELFLSPASTAYIASNLSVDNLRGYFLDKAQLFFQYTQRQIALANAYLAKFTGDFFTALSLAQDLVLEDSNDTEAANLAAEILGQEDYTYQARRFACHVLRREPSNMLALETLGMCLYKESRWKAARKVFKILHSINHDDISLSNSLTALPKIAMSSLELVEAANGFQDLAALLCSQHEMMGIERSIELCRVPFPSSFYLPYQGPVSVKRDLETACEYAKLSSSSLVQDIAVLYSSGLDHQQASLCLAPIRQRKKIRIAFISRFFSTHTNLEAHYGLIKNLDRDLFYIIIIHRPEGSADDEHNALNQSADKVVYLNADFGESCRTIYLLNLDILFFTDVGMYALDCVLTMPHLARKQITSWGLPHTTGLKSIDYHLRSSIFRDCEGPEEYTEQLVETDGYIGYFDASKYKLNPRTRDYFLLPPDRFLVGCLQSLHKIHPDFDGYLERIAKIDESILIVMSPSEHDLLMERFIKRIKKSAPTAYRQLCILKRTHLEDFFGLNHILDLNLDTIFYGAGITFVQTTWCGPPYVTEYSRLVRSSVVSRSYMYAGIDSPPVARDKNEYIDLVRYYFCNRGSLQALRSEIQQKAKGTIYNNELYLKSYEQFFVGTLDC
ncbi:MAG: hypothetical protein ACKO5F_07010 [Synechococcus sp.]